MKNKKVLTIIILVLMVFITIKTHYKVNKIEKDIIQINNDIEAVKEEYKELSNIAFIYKAEENTQLGNYYLEKGNVLTVYKDNSYKIVDENGIIINQE